LATASASVLITAKLAGSCLVGSASVLVSAVKLMPF
jgi:hypothetical protein